MIKRRFSLNIYIHLDKLSEDPLEVQFEGKDVKIIVCSLISCLLQLSLVCKGD
jgi:hypothetical protein